MYRLKITWKIIEPYTFDDFKKGGGNKPAPCGWIDVMDFFFISQTNDSSLHVNFT